MVGNTLMFSCRLEERLKCFLYNFLLQGVRSSKLLTPSWMVDDQPPLVHMFIYGSLVEVLVEVLAELPLMAYLPDANALSSASWSRHVKHVLYVLPDSLQDLMIQQDKGSEHVGGKGDLPIRRG